VHTATADSRLASGLVFHCVPPSGRLFNPKETARNLHSDCNTTACNTATSKCFANIIAHPLSNAPPPQHHPSVFTAVLIAVSTFAATVSTARSYLDRLSFTQTLLTMNCQPPTKRCQLSNQVSNQEMKAAELLAPGVLANDWSSKEAQSAHFAVLVRENEHTWEVEK